MENLWHLINPNFKTKVSMRVINNTLEDLLYVAIDQRLDMINKEEDHDPVQLAFLRECKSAKQFFIDKTCLDL